MRTSRHRSVLSEINVTPLVDVMLVMLVIFMVTAPLMQQGVDVNLPQAKGKDLPPEERISIIIKRDRTIYMNDTLVTMPAMKQETRSDQQDESQYFSKGRQRCALWTGC